MTTTLALAETQIARPPLLDGVEVIVAEAARRSFPTRLSESLGISALERIVPWLEANLRQVAR